MSMRFARLPEPRTIYRMAEEEHKELEELRVEIDKVDAQILEKLAELIKKRLRIVDKIGAYKRKAGLKPYDPTREEGVLRDRAESGRSKGLSSEMVGEIFESIVRHSRERE